MDKLSEVLKGVFDGKKEPAILLASLVGKVLVVNSTNIFNRREGGEIQRSLCEVVIITRIVVFKEVQLVTIDTSASYYKQDGIFGRRGYRVVKYSSRCGHVWIESPVEDRYEQCEREGGILDIFVLL